MNGPEGYHAEWGKPITKELTWYLLTDKWILVQKLRIPKLQVAKHMKLKKEDQNVDSSILLRRGNKILMERVIETKFRAETEGMIIQRLPHLGIHPINNHETQTRLWIPTRACWQEPGIAPERLCVTNTEVDAHKPSTGQNTGSPMKELEKVRKKLKGSATL